MMHGLNLVLLVVDFLFANQSIDIRGAVVPMILAFVYSVFTYVYYAAGGTYEDGTSPYIYEAIDWRTPAKTVALSIGLECSVGVAYLLIWYLYHKAYRASEPH